jgi:hypothetical protein
MLLITLHHFSLWGRGGYADTLINNRQTVQAFQTLIFLPIGDIGVYCFAMITGFYLAGKSVSSSKSFKKIGKIYLQMYFYCMIFLILGLHFHLPLNNYPNAIDPLMPFNRIPNILMSLMPITFKHYWFVTDFILLMLFVPYINRCLNGLEQKKFLKLLIIMIVSTGIFPLLNNNIVSETVGLGILMTSYMIGFYIKQFLVVKRYKLPIGLSLLIVNTAIIYAVTFYDIVFLKYRYIRIYTGIFALLAAMGLFLIFISLKPNYNILIDSVAKHMFAVYLVTENIFVIKPLWKLFSFENIQNLTKVNFYGFVSVVGIMLVICAIDAIREQIFNVIYKTARVGFKIFAKLELSNKQSI